MRAGRGMERWSKWWLSGGAALFVHALVILMAPPSRAPARQPEPTHALWLVAASEVLETPRAQPPSTATRAVTPTAAVTHPRPRRRAYVHVATQQAVEAVAAPAAPAAPGEAVAADAQGLPGSTETQSAVSAKRYGTAAPVRTPGLLVTSAPCRGYFPAEAKVDHGAVHIRVQVDEVGRAQTATLLHEWPDGHGFGSAARACAATLRFMPALNSQGVAVAGVAKLELVFERS